MFELLWELFKGFVWLSIGWTVFPRPKWAEQIHTKIAKIFGMGDDKEAK